MNQTFDAQLQPFLYRFQAGQGIADFGAQERQLFPLLGIGDIPAGADHPGGGAKFITQNHAPGRHHVHAGIWPGHPTLRVIVTGSGDGLPGFFPHPLQVIRKDALQENFLVVGQFFRG